MIRKLLCKLGWHKCNKENFDGISNIGYCKNCGKKCLQDSQGNWFSIGEENK